MISKACRTVSKATIFTE